MARLHDIAIDSRHPASIARFWAALLDDYQVAPYDEAELARLRAAGIFDPEDDPSVLVEAPGTLPRIFFQRVPEPKHSKTAFISTCGVTAWRMNLSGLSNSARAWWRNTTTTWCCATRKATSSALRACLSEPAATRRMPVRSGPEKTAGG